MPQSMTRTQTLTLNLKPHLNGLSCWTILLEKSRVEVFRLGQIERLKWYHQNMASFSALFSSAFISRGSSSGRSPFLGPRGMPEIQVHVYPSGQPSPLDSKTRLEWCAQSDEMSDSHVSTPSAWLALDSLRKIGCYFQEVEWYIDI